MVTRPLVVGAVLALTPAMLCSPAAAEGNRYKYPRDYVADISPVVAERELTNNPAVVLIDVRSVEEYVDGHAPRADHIPYPRVTGNGKDDPAYQAMSSEDFLAAVSERYPDRATPIITMCQSGGRSALAANILAKAGYTNVRSVFTGYAGLPLKDVDGQPVDANGNGVIHGVTRDATGQPAVDVGDLDGWAGFHGLPTTREVDPNRVLARFSALYRQAAAGK